MTLSKPWKTSFSVYSYCVGTTHCCVVDISHPPMLTVLQCMGYYRIYRTFAQRSHHSRSTFTYSVSLNITLQVVSFLTLHIFI